MTKKADVPLDIHITLPQSLASGLDRFARARQMKRSQLIREAIAEHLARLEREARDSEMKRYVERMAPHSGEFVRETDHLVARLLLEETQW